MPVQPPFTAGGKQTVEREHAEHLLPVRALATDAQERGEEGVQLEFTPELIPEPAGAPGAGPGELQLVQAHLHGGRVGGGGSAVLGKERALAGVALLFIEDLDGLLPGGVLGIVDLAQVENVTLRHRAPDAAAFDNGPGAMLLAVLFSGAAFEKHGGQCNQKK